MCISIIQWTQRNTHGGRIISSNPHLPLAQFRKRLTSNVTKSHRRPGIRATIIRIGAHAPFFSVRKLHGRNSRGARVDEEERRNTLGSILCHLAVGSSFRSCWTSRAGDTSGASIARGKRNKARGRTKSKTTDSWMSRRWMRRGAGGGSRLYPPVEGWDGGEEKQIQQVEATAADESGREWPDFYLLISFVREFLCAYVCVRVCLHGHVCVCVCVCIRVMYALIFSHLGVRNII